MYPYRLNGFIVRTATAQNRPVELAGQLLASPQRCICKLWGDASRVGYIVVWGGGDHGWLTESAYLAPLTHPHWPFGLVITSNLLPWTGGP